MCDGAACGSHSHAVPRSLFPLRAKRFESGFLEVICHHHHAKLAVGIERKKPGFREFRNLRRLLEVHDEDCSACSVLRGEVGGFRFHLRENPLHQLSDSAIAHKRVKRLVRYSYVEKHAHGSLLDWVRMDSSRIGASRAGRGCSTNRQRASGGTPRPSRWANSRGNTMRPCGIRTPGISPCLNVDRPYLVRPDVVRMPDQKIVVVSVPDPGRRASTAAPGRAGDRVLILHLHRLGVVRASPVDA